MIFMDSAKNSRRGFCLEKEVWLYLSSSRSRVFTPRSNRAFRNLKITLIVLASFGSRHRQPESSSDGSMTFPDNIAECQEWAEDKAVMKLAEKLKEEATDATACCFTPSARKAAKNIILAAAKNIILAADRTGQMHHSSLFYSSIFVSRSSMASIWTAPMTSSRHDHDFVT